MDLRQGFYNMPLAPESQPLTCFVTKFGAYMFTRLGMGLVNAPFDFSMLLEKCFEKLLNKCIINFLDDITTYTTESPQEHLVALHKTFECLETAGLLLNPAKCKFFTTNMEFLGFIISSKGLEQSPRITDKVLNFPTPTTKRQCVSFISLASYYRRFILNFAKITRPLHELVKDKEYSDKITWNDEAEKAFVNLKQQLTSAPILLKPNFEKPFFILTDASIDGLGAILTQLDQDGREHPVVYASRATSKGERNYGISKLELCAVVFALRQFRPYVLGSHFEITVVSDHACLNGLLNTKNPSGILARWLIELADYNFTIKYRPGKKHNGPDFLSRLGY